MKCLIPAYENGEITDEPINSAVKNLLKFVFKVDSERDVVATVVHPYKELKAFRKIELSPREEKKFDD